MHYFVELLGLVSRRILARCVVGEERWGEKGLQFGRRIHLRLITRCLTEGARLIDVSPQGKLYGLLFFGGILSGARMGNSVF